MGVRPQWGRALSADCDEMQTTHKHKGNPNGLNGAALLSADCDNKITVSFGIIVVDVFNGAAL